MSASAHFKQLLRLIAALALVALGLVSLGSMPAAQATDTEPCVETEDQVVTEWFENDPGAPWVATGNSRVKTAGTGASLTDWVNDGDPVRTEENTAPADPDGTDEASFTNLIRYVFVSETDPEVITPATAGSHYSWTGGNRGVNDPPLGDVPPGDNWTLQGVGFDPHLQGGGDPSTWFPTDPATSGLHVVGNSPVNASWFYYVPGTPAVTDTDYLWQKQVRTVVPGSDDVLEYEYSKTIEGNDCPDEEPGCDPETEDCPGEEPECDEETDHADQVQLSEESEHQDECDEDDDEEDCDKEPQMDQCKEPPVIGPGDGEDNGPGNNPGKTPSTKPGNSPSNNPGTKPGSNPQGSNQPNNPVTPALAPGAQVPSAVDAGLVPTQRELTGSGGGLGLLGMGTALVGAFLLGASFRPRRKVEAKLGTKA